MKFPMPHWFSIEELSARWEISPDLIDRYIQTGQLQSLFDVGGRIDGKTIIVIDNIKRHPEKGEHYRGYISGDEVARWEKAAAGEKASSRIDAIRVEIEHIIDQGTPCKCESVWRELITRCGIKESCCIAAGEDENGPFIRWRSGKGSFKTLRKNNLTEKLRTRKTE